MFGILRLTAERDGERVILAEYRGPSEGLKDFKLTRVAVKNQATEI